MGGQQDKLIGRMTASRHGRTWHGEVSGARSCRSPRTEESSRESPAAQRHELLAANSDWSTPRICSPARQVTAAISAHGSAVVKRRVGQAASSSAAPLERSTCKGSDEEQAVAAKQSHNSFALSQSQNSLGLCLVDLTPAVERASVANRWHSPIIPTVVLAWIAHGRNRGGGRLAYLAKAVAQIARSVHPTTPCAIQVSG